MGPKKPAKAASRQVGKAGMKWLWDTCQLYSGSVESRATHQGDNPRKASDYHDTDTEDDEPPRRNAIPFAEVLPRHDRSEVKEHALLIVSHAPHTGSLKLTELRSWSMTSWKAWSSVWTLNQSSHVNELPTILGRVSAARPKFLF